MIISYNTKSLLKQCLDSLSSIEDLEYEVVVIDNGSTDGSIELVKLKYPQIKLRENKRNLGFSKAANQSLKLCRGKYVFFLNSDAVITNPIHPVLSYFDNNSQVGVVGLKMLEPNGQIQPYTHGIQQTLQSLVAYKISGRFTRYQHRCIVNPEETDWVSGGAMLVRRELLVQLGGFDENFFFYFEDMDLCARVRELGYKVVYYPGILVKHLGGSSFKGSVKVKKDWYYRSQDYFFRKHYGWASFLVLKLLRVPFRVMFR